MILNLIEVAKAVTVSDGGTIAMTGYHESNGSDFNLLFAKYRAPFCCMGISTRSKKGEWIVPIAFMEKKIPFSAV